MGKRQQRCLPSEVCVLPQQESKIVPSKSIRAVCNWCCMGTAGWQTDGRDIWSYWRRIKGMLGNWPAWERRIKIGLPPTDAQLSITPHTHFTWSLMREQGLALMLKLRDEYIFIYRVMWALVMQTLWYNSENNIQQDFYAFHYLCVSV